MSLYSEDRSTIPAALILGACIAVGLAAGGWLIGKGMARFKSETRTVTVEGLVEREVKADQATWTLALRRHPLGQPGPHPDLRLRRQRRVRAVQPDQQAGEEDPGREHVRIRAAMIVIPLAPHDENNHAPNESAKVSPYLAGIRSGMRFLASLTADKETP